MRGREIRVDLNEITRTVQPPGLCQVYLLTDGIQKLKRIGKKKLVVEKLEVTMDERIEDSRGGLSWSFRRPRLGVTQPAICDAP
ncbi:hypothetical protein DPV78_005396 [Talaromyces pinophilus]|nr:hypothetical protein DPV78_005396 [Talaromyces pinophilus]